MEEELKKLKKELLKTQKDLKEVRNANKDKDRYYNDIIKTKSAEIAEKDKIIDLMALDIYGMQIECNRYFKDVEEIKQHFKKKWKVNNILSRREYGANKKLARIIKSKTKR